MNEAVALQPVDPAGLYFDKQGRVSAVANELAFGEAAAVPNDLAIASVLQFGAAVPPLSPWQGIQRFVPGYQYDGTTPMGAVQIPSLVASGPPLDPDSVHVSVEIEKTIDRVLVEAIGDGPHPVVLFSGGVDSGFIASRLVACGFSDSLLLNYSFGESDSESLLAEAMANHLGLAFERITDDGNPNRVLEAPGAVYPEPFGDHSAVPTAQLAYAVVDRLAGERRLILDGTGADGAFGMSGKIRKWRQISGLSRFAGSVASGGYAAARLWLQTGRAEQQLRILRRMALFPDVAGIIAQNPLAGVLYDASDAATVSAMLIDWIKAWAGDSFERRAVGADMALTCANVFVAKSRPIFTKAGLKVLYPFLASEILSLALDLAGAKEAEAKSPLKRSLASKVPEAMVYRPKSGFGDPRGLVFRTPTFIGYLDAATDDGGPIGHVLRRPNVRRAVEHLVAGRGLPPQTLNALWAIVFTDRWYRTVQPG